MHIPFDRTRTATALASLVLALGAGQALGAAFILQENSGSGLGNAYAGGAAASEDADTIWTNPAGMSRLKTNQVAAAVNFIKPSIKFSDTGSLPAVSCPPPLCAGAGLRQPLGGTGGNAGNLGVDPNLYVVIPINPQWAFGIGVNAPFGLTTEYDSDWIGRYQGIKSKIETINVNPAISYKFGNFSVGAGANYQHIKADFTAAVNYSGALAQAAGKAVAGGLITVPTAGLLLSQTNGLDALSSVTGDDDTWGWNIGAEWNVGSPDSRTRFGAAYRSAVKYNIAGNVNFTYPTLPAVAPPPLVPVLGLLDAGVKAQVYNGSVTSNIKLPDFANVSVFHTMLNDKWDFMGDVQWTHWSTIQDLTFIRTSGIASGTVLQSTPEHWKDAWRVSGGVSYRYTPQWTWRGGVAWDQTPVPDEFRTVRLPDSDRVWFTAGAQYKWSEALKFDVGAAYIWVQNGSIAQISTSPASVAQFGYVKGDYNNNVVIVSGQLTWSF